MVTSTRLPAAIELVRKLGRAGHEVYAVDTFRAAPGSHSKFVSESLKTPQPRREPRAYVDAVAKLCEEHEIDRLAPSFEEVFYLARERSRLEGIVEPFFPSFEVLHRLHDKVQFLELAGELSLSPMPFELAKSREELARATERFDRFFARAAYSRGGVTLYTNEGPLAGEVALSDCDPTPDNPFVVQRFLEGTDVCTYGIAHHGRLAAFSAYVHPLTMEHAGGIVFESIDCPEGLEATRRVVEATGYHGQISLDFLQTAEGLVPIECNPRPTAGVTVMPDEMFDDAFMGRRPGEVLVAPAGARRQLSLGLIRNMAAHLDELPENLAELLSGDPDVYAAQGDFLPFLYQVVAYSHVLAYRIRRGRMQRSDIMQGYFYDITWDGEQLQG